MNLINVIGAIIIFDAFYSLQSRWKEGPNQNILRFARLLAGILLLVLGGHLLRNAQLSLGIFLIVDAVLSVYTHLQDMPANYWRAARALMGVIIIMGVFP